MFAAISAIYAGQTDATSMVVIALAGSLEVLIAVFWFRDGGLNGLKRNPLWVVGILAAFGIAYLFWSLSQTGGSLCDQTSIWQGHGLWHLLAMGVVPILFFYEFRTETRS